MASRKVPTIFVDSRSLKVSVYDDGSFYISPGLIIVGGKSFFFKGEIGTIEKSPCRIGIKVEGDFTEPYPVNWPKHGDEVLVQAFYNLYGDQQLEEDSETLPDANPGIVLEPGTLEPGNLDNDPSTIEGDNEEESTACKATRATIKKVIYPSSYKEVRFVSKVSSIKAISLSLDSHSSNFKCLATYIEGKALYQHLYGPISFDSTNIKTKEVEYAASFSVFGECYASETINVKDIVLI